MVGRKEKRAKKKAGKEGVGTAATRSSTVTAPPQPTPKAPGTEPKKRKKKVEKRKPRPARPLKTAAVTLTTVASGTDQSVALKEAMMRARESIQLEELGIEAILPRRAVTGGLILEIPGPEGASKADALAEKMRSVLADSGVRVGRQTKMAELRVSDLDPSVTAEEVKAALAQEGGCRQEDIKLGEIRSPPTRLATAWAQLPLEAVRRIVEPKRRISVGWVKARVEYLPARPMRCYRCLEPGHVGQRCTEEDRSGRCYNCSEPGHRASRCPASTPKCPLCADLGRPSAHRLGERECIPPSAKRRNGPLARRGTLTVGEQAAAPVSGAAAKRKAPAAPTEEEECGRRLRSRTVGAGAKDSGTCTSTSKKPSGRRV